MRIFTVLRVFNFSLLLVLLGLATGIFAQSLSADLSNLKLDTSPKGPVVIALDEAKILRGVKSAPQRFTRGGASPQQVSLPGPDGTVEQFQLERVQTMHPDLQARYPEIMSFAGWKSDDPTMHVRAEYAPEKGWTISYRPAHGERVAIRPKQTAAGRSYERVRFSDVAPQDFRCLNNDEGIELEEKDVDADYLALRAGDCQLRQYRLALSCTGEYAAAVGGANPTVASVLAEMNAAVNRINEIYERDMGITMQLIARNDELIYFNAATDPYSNGNARDMIDESQETIDDVIGTAGYDIGHLFGTAGAGLAQLRSVCGAGAKASGITGIGTPTGDFFYIDYVAHEIGHQFGATHTFYNSCSNNITRSTAVEPGSGSTIMAYAGICAPNVQSRSDDLFHSESLRQMSAFITGGNHTCAVIANTSNNSPTVTLPQNSYSIPVSTAFELIADATDPDGNSLTYTWEQIDNDPGGIMPPAATNTAGPMFRALNVTADPRRRFPSGNNPTYEVLPSVARAMDFRVTVRDNDSRYGCTDEAEVRVSTVGSTPFEITNYNTPTTLEGLSTYTVEWDVAGTNLAPINTPLVNIYLSLDGGYTYDFALAEMVLNNGSADVTLPNISTTTARFVVKGHNNVFLDVNDADLTIEEPVVPTFNMTADRSNATSCGGVDVNYLFDIGSVLGFSESVTLSTSSLPAGVTASFTNNGQSGSFSSVLTLTGIDGVASGTYFFDVIGLAGGQQRSLSFVLEVKQAPSALSGALLPMDGADEGLVFTNFSWGYDGSLGAVRFELSGDPTFQTVGFSQLFEQGSINATGLAAGVYFWRVAYENECGRGPWSELRSFRRIPLDEQTFASTGSVVIGSGNPGTYSSTINVPRQGEVYQVEFSTEITHTFIGDLDAALNLPANLDVDLFDRPGVIGGGVGCDGNNISAIFADDAPNTAADFVATCTGSTPSIFGIFQPIDVVYTSLPREGSGDYTINVRDNQSVDGGSISSWDVTLWYEDIPEFNEMQTVDTIRVAVSGSSIVRGTNLSIRAAALSSTQTIFVLKELPTEGNLQRNGSALGLGANFSQADIDNNSIVYFHNTTPTTGFDEFTVDVILPTVGYIPNVKVPVRVSINDLTITGSVTNEILCAGDATGEITVTPSGGTQPYMYSLNSGPFQSSPVFSGLGGGTYSVTVRDATGLEFNLASIVVVEPSDLTLAVSSTGSSITAEASGGTSPYTYSIGGPFQASGLFDGLADDTYNVVVRDANGCEAEQAIVVAGSTLDVSLIIEIPLLCNGDLGMLVANATGGEMPYSYSLNNGPAQTSGTFPGLPEGMYTVTVTDAFGNSASSNAVSLIEPEVLTATATAASNTITVNVLGGTPTYTYRLEGGVSQTSNVFTALTNGNYTIEVTDANGCTATTQATINVNMLSVALQVVEPIQCNGDLAYLRANVAGGPPPYSYSLNNGPAQSSPDFNDVPAGSYSVTVTDGDGNMATSTTVLVIDPPVLVVAASVSGNTVTATPTGGTSPYEFSLDGVSFQASNSFSDLANGSYIVTVRDINGCTATATTEVNVNNLRVTLALVQPILCFGEMGVLEATVTGGPAPYTYTLINEPSQLSSTFSVDQGTYTVTVTDADGNMATSNLVNVIAPSQLTLSAAVTGTTITASAGGGTSPYLYRLDEGAFQPSEVFTNVNPGTYVLTVVDANSCETSIEVVVNPMNTLTVNLQLVEEILCSGALGVVQASASGGTGPYMYSLNSGPVQSTPDFDVAAGTYTVTVVDAASNMATSQQVIVTEPAPLAASATASGTTVTVSASGGTAPFIYRIDGGAFQNSEVFPDVTPGTYAITVQDANGCETTTEVTVNPTNTLSVNLQLVEPILCNGELGVLRATASSGSAPYMYSLNGGMGQSNSDFNVGPGTYAVTVTDGAGNMATSNQVIVAEPAPLTATASVSGMTITVLAAGGTSPYMYRLDGGDFQTSEVFSGVNPGSYTLTIQDTNGCETTTNATVATTGTLAVGVTFNLGQESCPGTADGAVTLTGTNGQPPYEYSLDGLTFQTGSFFNSLAAGNYTATVRDAAGGTATSNFDILARPVPSVDVEVQGSLVTFSNFAPATTGVEYSFDGGATFSATASGYYYTTGPKNVLIRYGSCQFTQTVSIIDPLVLSTTDIIVCADGTTTAGTICVSGGISDYALDWTGGIVSPMINPECPDGGSIAFPATGSTEMGITVTDATGAIRTVTVPVISPPAFTVGGTFEDGTITVTLSGGTAPFAYSLDGGVTSQTDPVFAGLDGTSYTVTVTDAFGCSVDQSFVVSSIGDLADQFGLQVFPNPMKDWLQVAVNADVQVDRLTLIDATGRLVLAEAVPSNLRLDVSKLTPGFYTLIIESPEGRAHVAVVRQ